MNGKYAVWIPSPEVPADVIPSGGLCLRMIEMVKGLWTSRISRRCSKSSPGRDEASRREANPIAVLKMNGHHLVSKAMRSMQCISRLWQQYKVCNTFVRFCRCIALHHVTERMNRGAIEFPWSRVPTVRMILFERRPIQSQVFVLRLASRCEIGKVRFRRRNNQEDRGKHRNARDG
jgi:hypothetical protein